MAITIEKDALIEQINHLKHRLAVRNVPPNQFSLTFRYQGGVYGYLFEDEDLSFLNPDELQERAPLPAKIFAEREDRDVIMICQPKFAMQMLSEGRAIEPVLDDLPQIVGMKCRICNGNDVERVLNTLQKHDACLLEGYNLNQNCLLTMAPSINRVLAAALIVEKSAQATIQAKCLGGTNKLSAAICRSYRRAYLTAYSQMDKSILSQTEKDIPREIPAMEIKLRQELVAAGISLLDEDLTLGTWGNLSMRLDADFMLITPSGMAYERLTPYDMVRVNIHTMEHEGRLKPSIEKGFHAAIYRDHPDINAVIHTHSFNSSVFSAAHQALPIVLPEAIMKLGYKTSYVPYYKPGTEQLAKAVADSITDTVWCTIMGNHGAACCGENMEDVFDRTRLMEKSAAYYIKMHQDDC